MFFKGAKETAEGARLRRLIEEVAEFKVDVGFNESSGSYAGEDGEPITVADVAAWNEFGTERAPARPFMRQTATNNKDKITKHANNALKKAIKSGGGAAEVLNSIGAFTKGRMQKEIRDGEFEPNAPSTIAKKGSSKPLIDTGRMRQSIVYVIKQKET